MKLSLAIPVYNEANHLKEFMDHLLKVDFGLETEYLVVDDHSCDDSWQILQAYAGHPGVRLHRQPANAGKGCALRQAFLMATGEIIAIQDADFEYDPLDLKSLLGPICEGKADVVFGSRFRRTNPQVHRTYHYLINRLLTVYSNVMSGLYLTDMETCYKVFRADLIKSLDLTSERFGFEPEVTAQVAKLSVRIFEMPISYYPRTVLQGKKIGWRDGFAALWFIFIYNFRSLRPEVRARIPKRYLGQSSRTHEA